MNRRYELIIAIDFDGTIVEHAFPLIGPLREGAKEVINKLYEDGYQIIIWTCRAGVHAAEAYNYLKQNEINFHEFNRNFDYETIGFMPSPKVCASIYIDDRNFGGIPSWNEIYETIKAST